MGTVTIEDPYQTAGWELSNIPFESLYLIELRQISKASWQPVICADIR